MKEESEILKTKMNAILKEKLPMPEAESLKDEGFNFKNPTRGTAVMVALYKKAASGDLSAIKELIGIVSGGSHGTDGKAVTIIEDI